MPFAVVAAAFALTSGSVAHVFVGVSGVPVAGVDFPFAAEPFAVVAGAGFPLVAEPLAVVAAADFPPVAGPSVIVAGAFVRGAVIPAAVAAAAVAAAAAASGPAWRHVHFAADDRGDSSWQKPVFAFCSAVLRADDQGHLAWQCLETAPCLALLNADTLEDSRWDCPAAASCSAVLWEDDRREFANSAVELVPPAGFEFLEGGLSVAQCWNAFRLAPEIGLAYCERRFQPAQT